MLTFRPARLSDLRYIFGSDNLAGQGAAGRLDPCPLRGTNGKPEESATVSLEHNAQRKARGAFFTPPEISRFIAEWALRGSEDTVLEPSCGEAEFLVSAGERLRALGAGLFAGDNLHGVEIHAPSAQAARERGSTQGLTFQIVVSDFFDVEAVPRYNAVIGNPPYVRYHGFTGDGRRKALAAALKRGVRLTKLTNAWAPFVVHASEFVGPKGRLGLVLPAELLSVNYAAEVRRYLLRRFARVRLIMFEELVFPGVMEEVVLLMAEGQGPAPCFELYHAADLKELASLGMERATWVPFSPEDEEKWLRALVPTEGLTAYLEVAGGDNFETLVEWGSTYLGSVTGNNNFFALSAADVREKRIPKRELVPISPPGSRHLRKLTFSTDAWDALTKEGARGYLFAPDPKRPSKAAEDYITAGEKLGVHKGYKCRNRQPWWRPPLVSVADLLLTYMDETRPRLVTNRAKVRHLNSLYGVKLKKERRALGVDLLPLAALNSVTQLGAELVGRAYGGGLLKLEPREADRLPMPTVALLEKCGEQLRALRPVITRKLTQGKLDEATKDVDRLLLTEAAGLPFATLDALKKARALLAGRRHARSGRRNGH